MEPSHASPSGFAESDRPADVLPAGTSKGRRFSRQRIAIWGGFALLAALVAAVAVSLLRYDRAQALHRAEAELRGLTRVLEEHVARTFGETDSALSDLGQQLSGRLGSDAPSERDLNALLRQRAAHLPQVEYLYVEREDGSLLADTFDLPRGAEAEAPKRGLPTLHDGLEIAAPVRSAHSGHWVTPVKRQIYDAAGKFVGVVGAAMSQDYFNGVYRDLQIFPDDAILIVDATRGTLQLRHPPTDGQVGAPLGPSSALGLDANRRSAVSIEGDETPAARLTAFRRLADYPLVVGASRPLERVLAGFSDNYRRISAGAALLIALLGVLALLLHRDSLRRDGDRQSLAEVNANLEERVRTRTAELEQSNRELVSFSYSISHDLRAPLRAINGYAHLLDEEYGDRLDEGGHAYLARLRKASLRMGELIDELLKLANVSRQPLHIELTDVSTMAREILDEFAAQSSGRVVHIHVEDGLATEADPNLLRTALQNLLGNAWKFTRDSQPALIQVGGRPHGQERLFYVTDNGVGFDLAHAGKLFEPFQQLHRNAGFEGSGIGLASVRRIVERHGGSVWAESAPGAGTTIFFTLPRSPAIVRRPRERVQV
ncbi:MAG TPA: ATP-binding protein [Zoogloea sp.]|uniref:sensor histidine kinase n=1 Tax=Zoogloea sp. TaxID=49181 RepID=UPI002BD71B23|nr:ATP-binding protein [Zoogloea sp.]HMZ75803.1 ATP-binding protein [Rhodocyclaceae bacterium]HNH14879.1 ATP-binding protein [Zoogloea sp.]HNI46536.1 ATP-binding protein [Zoogloea sp.]